MDTIVGGFTDRTSRHIARAVDGSAEQVWVAGRGGRGRQDIDVDSYMTDPALLGVDWTGQPMPIAFVALDRAAAWPAVLRLPPFPVIGLGGPDHPMAGLLDAVVEPPVAASALVRQVTGHRHAAAALVQLLRGIDGLRVEAALTMESLCQAMLQGSADHAGWLAARRPVPPMPPGRLRLTRDALRSDGATLRIVIDRPAARNAIDRTLRDALFEAFTIAALDPDIGRVELRSVGRAFSVGADLAEFGTTRDPATAHNLRTLTLPAHPLSRRAGIVDVHVQGACIGAGLEIAAFAGHVTASRDAWFQLPELAMGLIPGAGGCVSVARRIGRQRTALMVLSGRRIDAPTALRWGLIDAIVDEPPVDPGRPHAD